jgi:hypothetical protein
MKREFSTTWKMMHHARLETNQISVRYIRINKITRHPFEQFHLQKIWNHKFLSAHYCLGILFRYKVMMEVVSIQNCFLRHLCICFFFFANEGSVSCFPLDTYIPVSVTYCFEIKGNLSIYHCVRANDFGTLQTGEMGPL